MATGSPDKRKASGGQQAPDDRLVHACLKGDEQAWTALIDKYKRLIYSVPLKYRFGPEDASDIFQLVCLELFTELPKLRRTSSLTAWLITVSNRLCLRWKERRTETVEVEDRAADQATVAANLEEAHRDQRMRDALATLSPRCQTLIRMLFFEQPPRPYGEVARELGLAPGSIGFIRGRCLKALQKILEQLGL